MVQRIERGSESGDTFYSLNGKILKDFDEYMTAAKAWIPGEAVKVGYLRREELFEVVITTTERAALYLDWDKKRAEDGDAEGEMALGMRYLTGNGVSKNHVEAEAWLRKAADQGKPTPQSALGTLYMGGEGLPFDPVEAMRWFLKAADQGDATGEFNLGYGYENGFGVAKDLQQARSWYRKAAQQGQGDAKAALERLDAAVEQGERLAYEEKIRERRLAEEGERRVADEHNRRSRIALSLSLHSGQQRRCAAKS